MRSEEDQKIFDEGLDSFQRNHWGAATHKFLPLIQKNPQDVEAMHFLGRSYLFAHEFHQMFFCYGKFLDFNPDNLTALVYFGLSILLRDKDQFTSVYYFKRFFLKLADKEKHFLLQSLAGMGTEISRHLSSQHGLTESKFEMLEPLTLATSTEIEEFYLTQMISLGALGLISQAQHCAEAILEMRKQSLAERKQTSRSNLRVQLGFLKKYRQGLKKSTSGGTVVLTHQDSASTPPSAPSSVADQKKKKAEEPGVRTPFSPPNTPHNANTPKDGFALDAFSEPPTDRGPQSPLSPATTLSPAGTDRSIRVDGTLISPVSTAQNLSPNSGSSQQMRAKKESLNVKWPKILPSKVKDKKRQTPTRTDVLQDSDQLGRAPVFAPQNPEQRAATGCRCMIL